MSAPALALLPPPSDPTRELRRQAVELLRRSQPGLTLARVVLMATDGRILDITVRQDDAAPPPLPPGEPRQPRPPRPLRDVEKAALDALPADLPVCLKELARRAGYSVSPHFREAVNFLTDWGLATCSRRLYRRA